MLLLIDNFDSFTFNIVQAFQQLGQEVIVIRNQALTPQKCLELKPEYLVIGPGPGNPSGAGISKACIKIMSGRIPILGICLGHQAIGEVFGGKTIRAKRPIHGKLSSVYHQNKGVFQGLPMGFKATRYHSLIVDKESFPEVLEVTAETAEGEIMGIRHKQFPTEGVQFHPESIATEAGQLIFSNFLGK